MFDRLEDILIRYQQIMEELSDPSVVSDQKRFTALMKEQSDLTDLVEKYKEYKQTRQTIDDSLEMLESENEEEMREMIKEELSLARNSIGEIEQELKILLLPKDPLDEKNVIVEIRAGTGGEEAALFAAIASEVIWPRMTVCMAVFRPHRPDTTIMGAVTLI